MEIAGTIKMYDCLFLLYKGSHVDGQFLQVVDLNSFSVESTLLGGIGTGTYTMNGMPESLQNFTANNRGDLYLYRDLLAVNYIAGSTTTNVRDGTRFKVGDQFCIYNGHNWDIIGIISLIIGNVLTTTTSASVNNYIVGDSILILRHRGLLSAVDTSDNLQGKQNFYTTSYFNQFNNILINENVLSNGTVNFECGWVLFHTLQSVGASAFPDLILNQSNFLMTTSASGALDGGGNGNSNVGYSGTNASVNCMTFFTDIISQSNGGSTVSPPPQLTIDIDVHNVVRFHQINQTTPDVFLFLNSYKNDNLGDGLFGDVVVDSTSHIQDLTNIHNVINGVGGSDALGNAITVTVEDPSVNTYGPREILLTNSNCNSTDSLKNWCTGQLNRMAYPLTTFNVTIYPSRSIIDCTNYVLVGTDRSKPNI